MVLNTGSDLFGQAENQGLRQDLFWVAVGPQMFTCTNPDVGVVINDSVKLETNGATFDPGVAQVLCSPFLPDGQTIVGVQVFGTNSRSWSLNRIEYGSGVANQIAQGTLGQYIDANSQYGEIENDSYFYVISIVGMEKDDLVYGARIAYTRNN